MVIIRLFEYNSFIPNGQACWISSYDFPEPTPVDKGQVVLQCELLHGRGPRVGRRGRGLPPAPAAGETRQLGLGEITPPPPPPRAVCSPASPPKFIRFVLVKFPEYYIFFHHSNNQSKKRYGFMFGVVEGLKPRRARGDGSASSDRSGPPRSWGWSCRRASWC